MKLSVVIPVYNEINTIEEILSRVLEVDLPKEVIVVDDFSDDGTREFLKHWVAGRETEAEMAIGLEGARFHVTWKPHEIKTLRLERGATAPIEVNMLEEAME